MAITSVPIWSSVSCDMCLFIRLRIDNGRLWLPKGKPIEVNRHDFPDKKLGKAAPYGVYDVGDDQGYVNVGIDPDTGEFSVASIRRWWEHLGKKRYAKSTRLMITADS